MFQLFSKSLGFEIEEKEWMFFFLCCFCCCFGFVFKSVIDLLQFQKVLLLSYRD